MLELPLQEDRTALVLNPSGLRPFNCFGEFVDLFSMVGRRGMLESYIETDISDEQMLKVLESISLESTSEEKSSIIMDYDKSLFSDDNDTSELSVIPLPKDSKQLFKVGQNVPVTLEQAETEIINRLDFIIEKVEVFDSIKDFKQVDFNDSSLEILSENKVLDQTK